MGLRDAGDDRVGLRGVTGPVDCRAVGGEGLLEAYELGLEVEQRSLLDRGTGQA
jgi:hypothetical protein